MAGVWMVPYSSAPLSYHHLPPPKTTKEKKEERVKKKEEALKLKKKKETQILNNFGISKRNQLPTKKTPKPHRLPKPISKPLTFEIPFLTDFSIMEALARPNEGSPLNPVTDMSLVPLTIVTLNSHMTIPVLDLDPLTRIL